MKTTKARARPLSARRGIRTARPDGRAYSEAVGDLVEIGKGFYARGWVLGTSGNFSAVISREPLRLAITSTGLDKASLAPQQFLEMDEAANVVRGDGRSSAESLFFQAEDGIRDLTVTGVQTCALPISRRLATGRSDLFGLVIFEIANPFFPEII